MKNVMLNLSAMWNSVKCDLLDKPPQFYNSGVSSHMFVVHLDQDLNVCLQLSESEFIPLVEIRFVTVAPQSISFYTQS